MKPRTSARPGTIAHRVMTLLAERGPMTATQICAELETYTQAVHGGCNFLIKRGALFRVPLDPSNPRNGGSLYSLVPIVPRTRREPAPAHRMPEVSREALWAANPFGGVFG